jgi:hypothetical protein
MVLAFLVGAAYAYWCLNAGWLPEDDGTLAQGALRVLNGQLPHRDFVENYTGGLSCLHALAFKLGGINLVSLRRCVFLFFLVWLAAVLYIASRFTSAIPAAGVGVLAAVWSLPQYPAAMPSWYNLFFATFGAASLLRYIEAPGKKWLFLAGLCGGISFLIKIIGLYYVAAVLIFLLFREQRLSFNAEREHGRRSVAYSAFTFAGLSAFLASLATLMRHQFDQRRFIYFLLPAGILAVLVMVREHAMRSTGDKARFTALFRMLLPFLTGVIAPPICFLVPYALSHSLGTFFSHVFGLIPGRVDALSFQEPAPPYFLLYAAMTLALVVVVAYLSRRWPMAIALGASALLAVALIDPQVRVWSYLWFLARLLVPLIVAFGAAVLFFHPSPAATVAPLRAEQSVLLLSLAALCSIVQFPVAAPIYFCYSAPLAALALLAILPDNRFSATFGILAVLLLFSVLFAVIRIQPNRIYAHFRIAAFPPLQALNLPRAGGLKVESPGLYETLVQTVRQHSGSSAIIATPECPEVFFLSGLTNTSSADGGLSSNDLLNALKLADVKVVVLNLHSSFSASTITTPEVYRSLTTRFPHAARVGKYLVCWRE